MKSVLVATALVAVMVVVSAIIITVSYVSIVDNEASVRNQAVAQVQVVEAELDKMWKVIQQRTQVTKASRDTQLQLVEALIQGRSASFIKIIHEQNPDSAFSQEQFTALGNTIEAQRESFLGEQKKMIDYYRKHNTMFEKTVSGFVLSVADRTPIGEPLVISSQVTKQIMQSGEDNEVELTL